MPNSILVLDKVLWIIIRLLRVHPQLVAQHLAPLFSDGHTSFSLLASLSTLTKTEVFKPEITTKKQYLQYLRILCYSLFSYVQLFRFLKQPLQDHIEAIAQTAIQIVINFPPDCVVSSSPAHD